MARHFYEDSRRGRKMAGRLFLCGAAEETREDASKTEWKGGLAATRLCVLWLMITSTHTPASVNTHTTHTINKYF